MEQRFEIFIKNITSIYRSVQKIKNTEMEEFGLKGVHVMCLYFLQGSEEGLTSAQLCKVCDEDKAAISRAVALLKKKGLAEESQHSRKRYRNAVFLTSEGRSVADRVTAKVESALEAGGVGLTESERLVFYSSLVSIAGNLEAYFENLASSPVDSLKKKS